MGVQLIIFESRNNWCFFHFFFFQAEDGIRDAQESRGLGDVYKRQQLCPSPRAGRKSAAYPPGGMAVRWQGRLPPAGATARWCGTCLLYTSDAADDLLCVDLGGRRIIKKKKKRNLTIHNARPTLQLCKTIS